MQVLRSKEFWLWFFISGILMGLFFAWELGAFGAFLPSLPRPTPTPFEDVFTGSLVFLIALDSGLFAWQRVYGTCSLGASRATKVAGAIGAVTLLCPACLLIPISILGVSLSITFLAPYLPLLRLIALVLLVTSTVLLWPSTKKSGARGKAQ